MIKKQGTQTVLRPFSYASTARLRLQGRHAAQHQQRKREQQDEQAFCKLLHTAHLTLPAY